MSCLAIGSVSSVHGICAYIWMILLVNVGRYTIHGSYGINIYNLVRAPFTEGAMKWTSTSKMWQKTSTTTWGWCGAQWIFQWMLFSKNQQKHDVFPDKILPSFYLLTFPSMPVPSENLGWDPLLKNEDFLVSHTFCSVCFPAASQPFHRLVRREPWKVWSDEVAEVILWWSIVKLLFTRWFENIYFDYDWFWLYTCR